MPDPREIEVHPPKEGRGIFFCIPASRLWDFGGPKVGLLVSLDDFDRISAEVQNIKEGFENG